MDLKLAGEVLQVVTAVGMILLLIGRFGGWAQARQSTETATATQVAELRANSTTQIADVKMQVADLKGHIIGVSAKMDAYQTENRAKVNGLADDFVTRREWDMATSTGKIPR
jgi:hypothetical protein